MQLGGHCRDARPVDDRNDHVVHAHQIVHADEQRRALDRVELGLRSAVRLVVLVILPAHRVAALPFVLARREEP